MREVEMRENINWNDDTMREAAMENIGKARAKKRRRMKKQFWFVLAVFIIGIVAALSLTVLFPVKELKITGESRYSLEDIKNAVNVSIGSNMILTDSDGIVSRVEQKLPYVGNVTVSKKLGGTLGVDVRELPSAYAYASGDGFYIVNQKGKIVEKTDVVPADLCTVIGAGSDNAVIGFPYHTTNEDVSELFSRLTAALSSNNLPVTRIDLSDITNMSFVIENHVFVRLGASSDMEYKVSHAATVYAGMTTTDEGTLDLTWWSPTKKDAYFRRGKIEDILNGTDAVTQAVQGVRVDETASGIPERTSSSTSSTSSKSGSSGNAKTSSHSSSVSSKSTGSSVNSIAKTSSK